MHSFINFYQRVMETNIVDTRHAMTQGFSTILSLIPIGIGMIINKHSTFKPKLMGKI